MAGKQKGKPTKARRTPSAIKPLVVAMDIIEVAGKPGWYEEISKKHFNGRGIKNLETGTYMNAETALAWAAAKFTPDQRKQALAIKALDEVAKIAFADVRKIFGAGGIMHPEAIDDDTAASIAGIEVVTKSLPGKNGEEADVEHTHKIKFLDKMRALEAILKMNGDFVERTELTGKNGGPIRVSDLSEEEIDLRLKELEDRFARDSGDSGREG